MLFWTLLRVIVASFILYVRHTGSNDLLHMPLLRDHETFVVDNKFDVLVHNLT